MGKGRKFFLGSGEGRHISEPKKAYENNVRVATGLVGGGGGAAPTTFPHAEVCMFHNVTPGRGYIRGNLSFAADWEVKYKEP